MKIIGLTGGIGVGKTFVANIFKSLFNTPIYNTDIRAKEIMKNNSFVKKNIISLLGEESFINGKINKKFISNKIFTEKKLLEGINNIIHLEVEKDFKNWTVLQKNNYIIKESAILFESKSYKNCDYIITVTSDIDTRINRILKRDGTTKEEIINKIKNQKEEEFKIYKSDFIIKNNDNIEEQIININFKINESR